MIDTKEIKLDNWLYLTPSNMFVKVSQVGRREIRPNDSKGLMVPAEHFEPILLTEDILLKCGFETSDFYKTHYFKYENIDNNLRGDVFCFNIDRNTDLFNTGKTLSFSFRPFSLHLKYLHQLQNLYFEITGRELEINL